VRHLLWKQLGVDRDENSAGLGDAKDRDYLSHGWFKIDPDAVSANNSRSSEARRKTARPMGHFLVAKPFIAAYQSLFPWRTLRTSAQHIVN
jgi:hypothetical protein